MKNLIWFMHAEKLGVGGSVCLGNLLISGWKTLIIGKANKWADTGITLEILKESLDNARNIVFHRLQLLVKKKSGSGE